MKQLQLQKTIYDIKYLITLNDTELEQAYLMMKQRYLIEDLKNLMEQNPDSHFDSSHFEEFPELADWLYECFDNFYDANMTYNDLLELTLNHLEHACKIPQFYTELSCLVPSICEGIEKQTSLCEDKCPKYYRCSNIAAADERSKRWEELASMISMHTLGSCTCPKDNSHLCEAAKFLSDKWDIHEFFHFIEGKKAA